MSELTEQFFRKAEGHEDLDYVAIRVKNSNQAVDEVRDIINMSESNEVIKSRRAIFDIGSRVFKYRGKRNNFLACEVESVKSPAKGDVVLRCDEVSGKITANVTDILPDDRGCVSFRDERSKRIVCAPKSTGVVDVISLQPAGVSDRYLFIRAENPSDVMRLIARSKSIYSPVRDRISGEQRTVPFEEMREVLAGAGLPADFYTPGDVVKIETGGFKGETAKIVGINKKKGEIEVELVSMSGGVPVTVKLDKNSVALLEE